MRRRTGLPTALGAQRPPYFRAADSSTVTAPTAFPLVTPVLVHVRPLIGDLQVGQLDGGTLDSFYTILRQCRAHCDGRPFVEHRKNGPHDCTERCAPHVCRPLATSTIRKVRFCLSGALTRTVRWRWITVNPLDRADAPRGVTGEPDPPTPEQAAAVLNEAFKDTWRGVLLWPRYDHRRPARRTLRVALGSARPRPRVF